MIEDSNEQSPNHVFPAPGNYTVTMTVTDSAQPVNAICVDTVNVTVVPFTCPMNATPSSGTEPLSVDFSVVPTNGEAPYTFAWDFGDGTGPSAEQNPTHVYLEAGRGLNLPSAASLTPADVRRVAGELRRLLAT